MLAGRWLIAFIFIHEGVFLATNFDAAAASMAKLGVPSPALGATLALQLAAGLAIALGIKTRVAATALSLFCLATAVLFHNRFGIRDELLHFEKDIAMAGGLIVLAAQGAGAWSIDGWRPRSALRSFANLTEGRADTAVAVGGGGRRFSAVGESDMEENPKADTQF
jgi:putative oxidoreductase